MSRCSPETTARACGAAAARASTRACTGVSTTVARVPSQASHSSAMVAASNRSESYSNRPVKSVPRSSTEIDRSNRETGLECSSRVTSTPPTVSGRESSGCSSSSTWQSGLRFSARSSGRSSRTVAAMSSNGASWWR